MGVDADALRLEPFRAFLGTQQSVFPGLRRVLQSEDLFDELSYAPDIVVIAELSLSECRRLANGAPRLVDRNDSRPRFSTAASNLVLGDTQYRAAVMNPEMYSRPQPLVAQ